MQGKSSQEARNSQILRALKTLRQYGQTSQEQTVFTIMKARNQNADPNYPLKMNAEDIYNEIRETILSIAKADRKKAEIKVKTLKIRYHPACIASQLFRQLSLPSSPSFGSFAIASLCLRLCALLAFVGPPALC